MFNCRPYRSLSQAAMNSDSLREVLCVGFPKVFDVDYSFGMEHSFWFPLYFIRVLVRGLLTCSSWLDGNQKFATNKRHTSATTMNDRIRPDPQLSHLPWCERGMRNKGGLNTSPGPDRETRHEAGLVRRPAEGVSDDSGKRTEPLGFRNGHSLPRGERKGTFNGARWLCCCVSAISGEMAGTTISGVSGADVGQVQRCPSYQRASWELRPECGSTPERGGERPRPFPASERGNLTRDWGHSYRV